MSRLAAALLACWLAGGAGAAVVRKRVLPAEQKVGNLLSGGSWQAYGKGFARAGAELACDNGARRGAQRGAWQTVALNQAEAQPFVVSALSRAEGVDGGRDGDYALWLDLEYRDGAHEWGVSAAFSTGTHGWERREIRYTPVKPVKTVLCYLLLREHAGKAWFKDASLAELRLPPMGVWFDRLPVVPQLPSPGGFELRDVAAESDIIAFSATATSGLSFEVARTEEAGMDAFRGRVTDTSGRDRAVTLYYVLPVQGVEWRWIGAPRADDPVLPPREYACTARVDAGANGNLSRLPWAAVGAGRDGRALALDPAVPAFFRAGYSAGTGQLYLAYDFGLTRERPSAEFSFRILRFDAADGWRSAAAAYQRAFPEAFRVRVPRQGLWMPFQAVSRVPGWEDFGFAFKEGDEETAWDDAHGLLTFRYTEPLTWWMPLKPGTPWTMAAAEAEASRRAAAGEASAQALLTSGFRDEAGGLVARMRHEPWNDGAVWSMNSSPRVAGEVTDFSVKFGAAVREPLYGAARTAELDGEYVDSIEGYVTETLDFRRDHFAAAATPLVFSLETRKPGLFKGLIVQEYLRELADTMHGQGKVVMANGTPADLCWLAPWLDVMGTEWDWNPGGAWQPMSDGELMIRRTLCGAKPYCFLMNTDFDKLPSDRVALYMKRCLAYGMFPGFFSPDAANGHYFSRPDLYDRDRPLFKKYVPLIRTIAEAGWRPLAGAKAQDEGIIVERFGDAYLTVYNDTPRSRRARVVFPGAAPAGAKDLVAGRALAADGDGLLLTLDAGDVALLELGQASQSSTTPIAPERSSSSMR